jgi:hypothetical protein
MLRILKLTFKSLALVVRMPDAFSSQTKMEEKVIRGSKVSLFSHLCIRLLNLFARIKLGWHFKKGIDSGVGVIIFLFRSKKNP